MSRLLLPGILSQSFGLTALEKLQALFEPTDNGGIYAPWVLSSLWADSGRTTPASLNGDVAAVDDLSGNGNHLVQALSGRELKLKQTVGGLYYLADDGGDEFMASDDLASNIMSGGGFMSAAWMSDITGVTGVFSEQATSKIKRRVILYCDTRSSPRRLSNYAADSTDRLIDLSAALSASQAYVSSLASDGTNAEGYLDGVSEGSVAATANFSATTRLEIFRQDVGDFYLQGGFFGGIAIDRSVTPAERQSAESALAEKSGVTL